MALDTSTIPNIRSNFFLFIDVKTLLGLNVVMLFLDAIVDVFVCDLRDIIKICEGDAYYMYCDSEYYFQDDLFISLGCNQFCSRNINI
jgi:hypothetical protein